MAENRVLTMPYDVALFGCGAVCRQCFEKTNKKISGETKEVHFLPTFLKNECKPSGELPLLPCLLLLYLLASQK